MQICGRALAEPVFTISMEPFFQHTSTVHAIAALFFFSKFQPGLWKGLPTTTGWWAAVQVST